MRAKPVRADGGQFTPARTTWESIRLRTGHLSWTIPGSDVALIWTSPIYRPAILSKIIAGAVGKRVVVERSVISGLWMHEKSRGVEAETVNWASGWLDLPICRPTCPGGPLTLLCDTSCEKYEKIRENSSVTSILWCLETSCRKWRDWISQNSQNFKTEDAPSRRPGLNWIKASSKYPHEASNSKMRSPRVSFLTPSARVIFCFAVVRIAQVGDLWLIIAESRPTFSRVKAWHTLYTRLEQQLNFMKTSKVWLSRRKVRK